MRRLPLSVRSRRGNFRKMLVRLECLEARRVLAALTYHDGLVYDTGATTDVYFDATTAFQEGRLSGANVVAGNFTADNWGAEDSSVPAVLPGNVEGRGAAGEMTMTLDGLTPGGEYRLAIVAITNTSLAQNWGLLVGREAGVYLDSIDSTNFDVNVSLELGITTEGDAPRVIWDLNFTATADGAGEIDLHLNRNGGVRSFFDGVLAEPVGLPRPDQYTIGNHGPFTLPAPGILANDELIEPFRVDISRDTGGDVPLQDGWEGFNHEGATAHTQTYSHDGLAGNGNSVAVTIAGNTHYRDYAAIASGPFVGMSNLLSDSVLRNAPGTMTLTLDNLLNGAYEITTYHHGTEFGNGTLTLELNDGNNGDTNNPTLIVANADGSGGAAPVAVYTRTTAFEVVGGSPVVVHISGGATGNHVQLNGFEVRRTPAVTAVQGNPADVGQTIITALGAELTIHADGSFTYDPTTSQQLADLPLGQFVTDSVTYDAASHTGGSGAAQLQLKVQGSAAAGPDFFVVEEDAVFNGLAPGVLRNDAPLRVDFGRDTGRADPLQAGFAGFQRTGDGSALHAQDFDTLYAADGNAIEVAVLNPTHYRDYAAITSGPFASLSSLLSDSVLRNAPGTMTVRIGNLRDGTYEITTYHHSTQFGDGVFDLALNDGANPDINNPTLIEAGVVGSGGTTPTAITARTFEFQVIDGSDTLIHITGGANVNHAQINGFELTKIGDVTAVNGNPADVGQPAQSAAGAAITVNADGSFQYDPSGAAAIQAIALGQTGTDSFTYSSGDIPLSLLRVDINDNDDNPEDNQEGFTPLTELHADGGDSFSRTIPTRIGNVTVDVDNAGGTLDDRHRDTPVAAGGVSEAAIYRDFVFQTDSPAGSANRLELHIGGLAPDTAYEVRLWSFDTSSGNDRVSDWSVTGGASTVTHPFDSADGIPADSLYSFTLRGVSDGAGGLTVTGAPNAASQAAPTLFLNGFEVSELVPNTATANLIVIGANDAPVAADDAFTATEDSPLGGNVLTNPGGPDSDPDTGDAFAVQSVVDANNNGVPLGSPTALPSGALLTINADGSFDYDPNGQFESLGVGQTASDTLTYTVTDFHDFSLAVDINDNDDTPGDLQSGFEGLSENDTELGDSFSRIIDGVSVNIDAINGGLDDRHRTIPADSGSLTQEAIYRDFLFHTTSTVGSAAVLQLTLSGLPAHTPLEVRIWSFDDGSNSIRSSDWSITGGAPVTHTFNGTDAVTADDQYSFVLSGTTDADGTLVIAGTPNASSAGAPTLFLNAFELSAQNSLTDTATVTFTVEGANDGPTAVDDVLAADEDNPASFDVLANDTDIDANDDPSNFVLLDPPAIISVSDPSAAGVGTGSVSAAGNLLSFDPAGDFDSLAAGELAVVTVQYNMTDAGGLFSSAEAAITVAGVNDAPAVSAGGPYAIAEGDSLTLAATVADADTNDSHTISWDLNGDGDFSDASGSSPTLSWTQLQALAPPVNNGPASLAISVRVNDGSVDVDASAALSIANTAPAAFVTGPASAVLGFPVDFTLSAVDVSDADQAGQFHYTVDWGDGSPPQSFTGASPLIVSHTFINFGSVTVSVAAEEAVDGDLSSNTDNTHTLEIVPVDMVGDDVLAFGTPASDRIIFYATNTGVRVRYNNVTYPLGGGSFTLNGNSRLLANGEGGADQIIVSGRLAAPAVFDGGDGNDYLAGTVPNDTLVGGSGNDVLLAGDGDNLLIGDNRDGSGTPGNDRLEGRDGADTLYGGGGNDRLTGGGGNDLLDGGTDNDFVFGGLGNDFLAGGEGMDTINGHFGNDLLFGGADVDSLFGGSDQDLLLGGSGGDRLRGDAGEDTLVGGNSGLDSDLETALAAILAGLPYTAAQQTAIDRVAAAADGWFNTQDRTLLESFADDNEIDDLTGGSGVNTFQLAASDRIRDFRAGDILL